MIELLLRTALEYLQDSNDQRNKYEAALRRELATLRARKRHWREWPYYDCDELRKEWITVFGSIAERDDKGCELYYRGHVRKNSARWRKDRTEGNWGKYLQREKEIRRHAETLA